MKGKESGRGRASLHRRGLPTDDDDDDDDDDGGWVDGQDAGGTASRTGLGTSRMRRAEFAEEPLMAAAPSAKSLAMDARYVSAESRERKRCKSMIGMMMEVERCLFVGTVLQ